MFNILVIEDEKKLCDIIEQGLQQWGYEVSTIEDFQKVEDQFLAINPHLVLLDINLPYYNGFYWCERIRKHSNVPILFVSSRTEQMDMMMALNMGGDDFIQKPFSMDMLITKIHAILRRTYTYHTANADVIQHRDIVLHLKKATVYIGENEIDLTKNEFRILCILLEHKQEIVTRDEMMNALWENEHFIDDNTLTVNVNRLRKKLSNYGLQDYIVTKKGQGYILQ